MDKVLKDLPGRGSEVRGALAHSLRDGTQAILLTGMVSALSQRGISHTVHQPTPHEGRLSTASGRALLITVADGV